MFIILIVYSVLLNIGVKASPTLSRRDFGPLFGSTGLPSIDDIIQHHMDCAYIAPILALTDRAPEYVKSLIQYEGEFNSVSQVTATCWTIKDDIPQIRKTIITLEDCRNRNDTKGDNWWGGALYQAPIHEGIVIDPEGQGGMPILSLGETMTMITGKRVEGKSAKNLDEFWNLIIRVKFTPLVICTKDQGNIVLFNGHAYALTQAEIDINGNKMVDLINTDGSRLRFSAEDVFHDTVEVVNWIGEPSFIDERAP